MSTFVGKTAERPARIPYTAMISKLLSCITCHSNIFFTRSHEKLCLCIVMMGSSRDIDNGNQVQILWLKLNGILNHVVSAQFSCNSTKYLSKVQTIEHT